MHASRLVRYAQPHQKAMPSHAAFMSLWCMTSYRSVFNLQSAAPNFLTNLLLSTLTTQGRRSNPSPVTSPQVPPPSHVLRIAPINSAFQESRPHPNSQRFQSPCLLRLLLARNCRKKLFLPYASNASRRSPSSTMLVWLRSLG